MGHDLHISYSISEDCWNIEAWAYGICHHCGCCSKDKLERYESRIRLLEERLDDQRSFEFLDESPERRSLQEKNIASNIKRIKRKLRYYREKVDAMKESNND